MAVNPANTGLQAEVNPGVNPDFDAATAKVLTDADTQMTNLSVAIENQIRLEERFILAMTAEFRTIQGQFDNCTRELQQARDDHAEALAQHTQRSEDAAKTVNDAHVAALQALTDQKTASSAEAEERVAAAQRASQAAAADSADSLTVLGKKHDAIVDKLSKKLVELTAKMAAATTKLQDAPLTQNKFNTVVSDIIRGSPRPVNSGDGGGGPAAGPAAGTGGPAANGDAAAAGNGGPAANGAAAAASNGGPAANGVQQDQAVFPLGYTTVYQDGNSGPKTRTNRPNGGVKGGTRRRRSRKRRTRRK